MSNIFTKVDVQVNRSFKRYSCPKVVTETVESEHGQVTYETVKIISSKEFNDGISNDFNKYTLTDKLRAGVPLKEVNPSIPAGHEALIENDVEIQRGINDLAESDVDVSQFKNE